MNIIHIESPLSPVTTTQVWTGVGSFNENEKVAGLSHFIEHLVFKGTKKRAPGDIANEVENFGGDLNAYTSFDRTVYHITAGNDYFSQSLDILSDMMKNPTFDTAEVDLEREVVLEEIRISHDNPSRVLFNSLFEKVFSDHPYARPVIGYPKIIKNVPVKSIKNYFEKFYVSENMTLVTAGPQSLKEVEKLANLHFKGLRKGKAPSFRNLTPKPQNSMKAWNMEFDVHETHLALGFALPGIKQLEQTALVDLLISAIGSGDSSRLTQTLQENQGLVNYISGGTFLGSKSSLGYFVAGIPKGNTKKALKSLAAEIAKALHEGITEEELERVKTNLIADRVYSNETVDGLAERAGYFGTLLDSLDGEKKYMEFVQKATTEGLKECAQNWLSLKKLNLALLHGKDEKSIPAPAEVKKIFSDALKAKTVKSISKKSIPKKPILTTLSNGVRVITRKDSSTPAVSMQAALLGGSRSENEETNGINNLIADCLERGTQSRTAKEYAEDIEKMASNIWAFSGKNSNGMAMTTLKKNFHDTLELFNEAWFTPSFSEEEINRGKRLIKQSILTEEDEVARLCVKNFLMTIFKNHPYRLTVNGTLENLDAFTKDDLETRWFGMQDPEKIVISVSGDIEESDILKNMDASFGNLKKRTVDLVSNLEDEKDLTETRNAFIKKDKEQCHVVLGYLGLRMSDPEVYTLKILSSILSGMGGRLFTELREKKGLAYTVSPLEFNGIEKGYYGSYIGCMPDKLNEAITGMKTELEKLAEKKVSAAELKRAKQFIIGSQAISLQRNSAMANTLAMNELFGQGFDYYLSAKSELKKITAEQIRELAEKLFIRQNHSLSIVGPTSIH